MLDVLTRARIGIISIDRPDRRNAMDRDMVAALAQALRRLDADPAIAVIVLSAEPPGFYAGSDLKFIGRLSLEEMCRFEAETGDILCFASEAFDGGEAKRLGLVDHLAEPDHANEVAFALAERMAALPPTAVAATKRYFMHDILSNVEVLDVKANEIFAGNCRHPVGRATLERFGNR
jgi:enoyl-CoA hydratase/carnithine racemase